jgi:hypothetical protein
MPTSSPRTLNLAPLAVALAGASGACAQPYTFTKVADSATLHFEPFTMGAPSISDLGHVAFNAQSADHAVTSIFRSGPSLSGPLTLIVDSSSPLGTPFDNVSVNNAGQVAVWAPAGGGGLEERIVRGSGGPPTTIAEAGTGRMFNLMSVVDSVNDSGVVAWQGELNQPGFPQGLFTGTGGAVTTVFSTASSPFTSSFAGPVINNPGQIAFRASTATSHGDAIFRYDGGATFTTIADSSGILSAGFDQDPSMNNAGRVAVIGRLEDALQDEVVLVGDGTAAPEFVIDTTGPLQEIASVSINDSDAIAYIALFDDFQTQGIFTGPDLINDAVIRTGDILDGSPVTNLRFFREGLNNSGQIAFYAELADGRALIMVATPVPAPASLVLITLTLPVALHRRRR